ncbi:hypothetical protein CC1G_07318 [Coprinopsis cinerea okayama7|uniref:MARVEL domain-containing protein n=1 Tax=Coprinopsis cinerea (strain Okayama-7 / 130 / ATCC MYA-4618 / FGSC 9003) TaxID=240176 RepID=A8NNQ6_COPC7|nr:hypothetical protein CC1G_07318 [Coprinopsis cinerea okayama7\|eukprot:XP_001835176.2 hypothetical protein CC1G_07318 [Coprinopsis cinerea okayama7\
MTATTNNQVNGAGGSTPKQFAMSLRNSLAEWRVYLGIATCVVALTLILGIITLSFVKPKVEPLLFGLDIAAILLSLATFAALCFFIQRAKDQKYGDQPYDPNYIDILIALGIATLFGLTALAELKELPQRCYSGPNEDFKAIGPEVCGVFTTMGVLSCLGGSIMLLTCILIAVAIREAIEVAKLPPPVFPTGAEPAVMRWLDRNDPFNVSSRDPHRQNSYGP